MHSLRLFDWQALDEAGDWQRGLLLADDRQQVLLQLEERNLAPLRIRARRRYRPRDWQDAQRITLMRQLATLLKAGMTLAASLGLLSQGNPHPGWQALLSQLETEIVQGIPFTQALQRWQAAFPPIYASLVHIGELTGQLENCCQRLADQQERQLALQKKVLKALQKKVLKALRYPLFILLVAAGVSSGMLLFVLPEFVSIYASFDAPLPAFTAGVMGCASLLRASGPWLLACTIALCTGWRWQRRRSCHWRAYEQQLLLKLPLISTLYRGNKLSQIFNTLSMTQSAGLTLLESLKAAESTLVPGVWQATLVQLQQHIEAGQPLHLALHQHPLFTPLCYQLVKVGEESGALDEMLARLAQWHEAHTHEKADTLAAMLEPMMMLVTGGIVGVLVIAMYLPVFNLGSALG